MTIQRAVPPTASGELAYAHLGAARIAFGGPRWPARIVFVESGARHGFPDSSHHLDIDGYSDGLAALLAIATDPPAAIVVPTDVASVDFTRFVEAVLFHTEVPVIVGLGAGDDAAQRAYDAIANGARSIVSIPCTSDQLLQAVQASGIHSTSAPSRVTVGAVDIDPDAFQLHVAGVPVALSPREFLLLHHLAAAAPRVVGLDELARSVSTYEAGSPDAIRTMVKKVRRKIELAAPDAGEVIETVRGVGYRIIDR